MTLLLLYKELTICLNHCAARQCLVDKTNFGLAINNHANFYRFEETSSYWSVKQIEMFVRFCNFPSNRQTGRVSDTFTVIQGINNLFKPLRGSPMFG